MWYVYSGFVGNYDIVCCLWFWGWYRNSKFGKLV